MTKLEVAIAKAETRSELRALIDICDKLHSGEQTDVYTVDDLPLDSVYEFYKAKLEEEEPIPAEQTSDEIMIMSSVPKPKEPVDIDDILILPKFDGCSLGMRFERVSKGNLKLIKAHTRGRNSGGDRINRDVTDKINKLITRYKTSLKNLKTVDIRGEIVLNYRCVDSCGNTENVPAAIVAGKLNGGMEVFEKGLDDLAVICYEISSITYMDDTTEVPSQIEAINILRTIWFKYNDKIQRSLDFSVMSSTNSGVDFSELYEEVLLNETRPTDGLIYCCEDWRYPSSSKDFTAAKYGKYAWKPARSADAKVISVEYSMGRNGNLNPMITYEEIILEGKKNARTSSAISKLSEMIKLGLGPGSVCRMEMVHSIKIMIRSVLTESKTPFVLPRVCEWCKTPLDETFVSEDLLHLSCNNPKCSELCVLRYEHLISYTHKVSKKALVFRNSTGKIVKSAIAGKKLREIHDEFGTLDLDVIEKYVPNFREVFMGFTLEHQLVALSYGGVTQVAKYIKTNKITKLSDLEDCWCEL